MGSSIGKPRLAITLGDPVGIGPEIVRAALERGAADDAEVLIFGREISGRREPSAEAGRVSYEAVMQAIEAVKTGRADAIVTAPISKEAWHAAGITAYPGHTELLAEAFDSPRSGMLFVGPRLRVILVTIHIALRDVPSVVTAERVFDAIDLGHRACVEMGIMRPRLAVAGLNPHAGEHGLFGDEDERLIVPAVSQAKHAGMEVCGPLPGDTVFSRAAKGEFDLVVAMYHDQGLIPVKLLDGPMTVNVTTGLKWKEKPVVRTSPAHGTAFDIAGRGLADATSMIEAIRLAGTMARRSRA